MTQLIKWYYDEKKWTDVFGTKTYEYLKNCMVIFLGLIRIIRKMGK